MSTASATVERQAPEVSESAATRIVRFLGKTPVYAFLAFVGLLWLVPTIGLLFTSLLQPADIGRTGWWHVITQPSLATLDNYRAIFENDAITSAIWTTLWISLGATILPIAIASLAAYAFAWLEFPGRDWIFLVVVALLVVPIQMALIPIFSLYNDLGLFDTIPGLVLFHTAFGLPFAIFLLRNFFIGIPRDLLEAARIDGASELRIFLRLILPLGLPAIASLAIFQFLWVWNDLLVALTFARDTQPITVAIFSQMRQFSANIELIAPAAFISLLIPLAVFFAFQRYFVQGLLAGSVK
jgi:alpha-glucoside transport system permease protein